MNILKSVVSYIWTAETLDPLLAVAITEKELPQIIKILGCLSKNDSYRLFIFARNGLPRGTDAHLSLNLSRKRYYSALQKLARAGLIYRKKSGYYHTALGSIVYRSLIEELEQDSLVKNIAPAKS